MRGPINSTMRKIWKKICKSKVYRDSYVAAHVSNTVAAQITLMREEREWTQTQLAEKAGMKQSRISTLEDPNYENVEIGTLKRLASAFDVGLTIRFVPFSELVNWAEHHTANDLNVVSLEKDSLTYDPVAIGTTVIDAAGFPGISVGWTGEVYPVNVSNFVASSIGKLAYKPFEPKPHYQFAALIYAETPTQSLN